MALPIPTPRRRRGAWLVLIIFVLAIGGVMAAKAPALNEPTQVQGLPSNSQSYQAAAIQAGLPQASSQPAFVVYQSTSGQPLVQATQESLQQNASKLAHAAATADPASESIVLGPLKVSKDGTVAVSTISIATAPDDNAVASRITALRAEAAKVTPSSVSVNVTGGPAFTTDLADVFNGADTTLLIATALVVAVLLLITYRSPILWIIPLLVVGMADQVSQHIAATLAPHLGIRIDGGATGISQVLVFGAGTDYALLLIARYRDQLRQTEDRFAAMRVAVTRTGEAIVASGVTVTLSLLTLLLAGISSTRAIGFCGAIGIVVAVVFGLVLLPAALVLCGRGVFWPLVPKVGDHSHDDGKVFAKIGGIVKKRPGAITLGAIALLVLASLPGLSQRIGLSTTQQFTATPESVVGQNILASSFPAGTSDPVQVLVHTGTVAEVESAIAHVPGVTSVSPNRYAHDAQWTELDVITTAAPGSNASFDTITHLRDAVGSVPGSQGVVGGTSAQQLDFSVASSRDARVIIPLVLLIVLAVLLLLLRAVVAPVLLLATVIGTYLASLGISWFIFDHIAHYPAIASGVRLYAFLFLVALGVDYNIFLTSRAREETITYGTRDGMLRALTSTGGVITSAGILLAAVFAVLGVLPLIQLTQVGIIVCVGVLLDTLLVRTVLVPSLAMLLGNRFWWPKVPGSTAPSSEPATQS